MDTIALQRSFAKMGARVVVSPLRRGPRLRNFRTIGQGPTPAPVINLDVRRDADGEYFSLNVDFERCDLQVLDVQPQDRHLLLLSRDTAASDNDKSRFLLGHDERHWFVAAVPESTPVSRVRDAKQALKPQKVVSGERNLRPKDRHRRRNDAWIRQGEWFFVPAPDFHYEDSWKTPVLRNEPIVRSRGGKPHMCAELVRFGGDNVWVHSTHAPSGLTTEHYQASAHRGASGWRSMRRNAQVYVRGKIRHPDHKTVVLNGWHEVHVNNEFLARAMSGVVFLD